MQFKKILVHTDSSAESFAAAKAATILAEKFSSLLTGFYVMPDIAVAAAMPAEAAASPQLVEEMQDHAEEQAGKAEAIFREVVGGLASEEGWIIADGMGIGSRAAAADVSHFADLIAATREDKGSDEKRTSGVLPQDLVVDSGRPMLLVPPEYTDKPIGDQIVIAWSNSREATRAVYDALPFLGTAKSVRIVSVVHDVSDGSKPGEKIAEALAGQNLPHMVDVDAIAARHGKSTSETLFDYLEGADADLLVAGAYSHLRLREGLFGGVTKSIMEASPIPALLSH